MQISKKLLDPQILFESNTRLKIVVKSRNIFWKSRNNCVTWCLRQQSASVRGFPCYLPFQNGGWTREKSLGSFRMQNMTFYFQLKLRSELGSNEKFCCRRRTLRRRERESQLGSCSLFGRIPWDFYQREDFDEKKTLLWKLKWNEVLVNLYFLLDTDRRQRHLSMDCRLNTKCRLKVKSVSSGSSIGDI